MSELLLSGIVCRLFFVEFISYSVGLSITTILLIFNCTRGYARCLNLSKKNADNCIAIVIVGLRWEFDHGADDDIDSIVEEVICVQDFLHVFSPEDAAQSEIFQALNKCSTVIGVVGITRGWPAFSLPNLKKVDGTLALAYTTFDPAKALNNLEEVNVLALEGPLFDGDAPLESFALPKLNYISELMIAGPACRVQLISRNRTQNQKELEYLNP